MGQVSRHLLTQLPMKKALIDQKEIAYRVEGKGDCLVLIHGFPEDHRIWDDFSKKLSPKFTVISVDLPGFGESAMLGETHSMDVMAMAIKAILDEENIEHCVLAGHSMGGYVALAFMKDYPQYVEGIVLFHSQATADDELAAANRDKAILQVLTDKTGYLENFTHSLYDPAFHRSHPEIVARLNTISHSQSERAIIAALAGMRDRESHINLLTQLKCPVLFILGKSDNRMPAVKIMAQAGLPPHAELLMIDQVGHMGFVESPVLTRLTLEGFAEKCFMLKNIKTMYA
jgi:pimeloyl-ACP methyl ester carboxylesterase